MRKIVCVLVLLLSGFGLSGAAAPSLDDVVKVWTSALGGREQLGKVHSIYSKATVEMGGLSGVDEEWVTVEGNHRSRFDLGDVYRNLTVFDGQRNQGWVLDQNGKVRELDEAEIKDEMTSSYLNSFSFLFPDRRPGTVALSGGDETQSILKLSPEGGREVTIYIDNKSGLPLRQEQPQQDRTVTLTFSNWKVVDGINFPYQIRQSTGDPKYDVLIQLQEIKINPPAEAALFARPEEAAPDFRFASGNRATGIPFELTQNHIFLKVSVNGSGPLWFLLDTGAAFPVLNEKKVAELGLKKQGNLEGRGAGEGTSNVSLVANLSYKLPGVELLNQRAGTLPLDSIEGYEGRKIDGILGYDFISRFVTEIDYANRVLNLYDVHDYKYEGSGEIVPIALDGNIPKIKATVTVAGVDPVEGRFDIDTGARSALVLNNPFHSPHEFLSHVPKKLEASWGFGVGGQSKDVLARIEKFQIGKLSMENVLTSFSLDTKGAFADKDNSGNIGGELLRRFKVIFDYSNKRMILEPNEHFSDPYEFDMSGMALTADTSDMHAFKVLRVVGGSPAEGAGIKPGDLILKIDGRPASEFTLEQVRDLFKIDGGKHALSVRRENKSMDVAITLHRLI